MLITHSNLFENTVQSNKNTVLILGIFSFKEGKILHQSFFV